MQSNFDVSTAANCEDRTVSMLGECNLGADQSGAMLREIGLHQQRHVQTIYWQP